MAFDPTVDQWKLSREKTKKAGQPSWFNQFKTLIISTPGRPAYTISAAWFALAKIDKALGFDLSFYEQNQSLQPYKDAGFDHAMLRMGGPSVFMMDQWAFKEDVAWRKWFTQGRALQFDSVGGYFIYSAGPDSQDYENSEVNLGQMDLFTSSGYMPDWFWLDDEVDTWFENNRTVTATDVNQVHGLRVLATKTYKKFRKTVAHYSANWFVNKTAGRRLQYETWLDAVNKPESLGGPGKQILSVRAWYPTITNSGYTDADGLAGKLPIPTGPQEAAYLNNGNYTQWDAWQACGDIQTPWGKCDVWISKLSKAAFNELIGVQQTTPPEPPTPPAPNGDYASKADFDALKLAFENHTHTTGKPGGAA